MRLIHIMAVVPFFAMLYQLGVLGADGWWQAGEYHLVVAGVIICALEVWMVAEAIKLWPRIKGVLETDLPPLPRGFPVAAVEGVNPQSDGGRSC